jgi:hypothetical protein
MPWTPQQQVIDLSQLADNLLGYIEANQTAALSWANGGAGLDDFAKFYTNASGRLQTIFPSLMILTQRAEEDLAGDALQAGWEGTLEATVSGGDPDMLVANTKLYEKAIKSMLANIPSDTLTANSDPITRAHIFEIETRFDILRGQSKATGFLQIFQVRFVYSLLAEAF